MKARTTLQDLKSRALLEDEAAAFINRPANTLRYWRYKGKGPRYGRASRRIFYLEDDLKAWLDAQIVDDSGPSAA